MKKSASIDNSYGGFTYECEWQGSLTQNLLFAIASGLAFYYSARIGHALLSFPPDYIAVFWPPNTIVLAALVFVHPRRWWIYFIAMLSAYLIAADNAGFSFQRTIIFFIANFTEVLFAATALRYFLREQPGFTRLREVAVFLVFVILASTFSASIAAIATLIEPEVSYWLAWRVWFLSDALAHLTLTPVLLIGILYIKNRDWIVSWKRYAEASLLIIGLIVVSLIVFGSKAGSQGNLPALVYTPLPLLLWAAVRFGPWGASSAVLFITVFSVWNAAQGRGPFTTMDPADNVFSLQLFLMVISLPLMILSALIQEHARTNAALHASETRLSTLISSIPDLIWLKDPEGVYLTCNSIFERLFGAKPEQIIGKTDHDFVDKDLADFFRQKDIEAMGAGESRINEEWVTFADNGHKVLLETIKTPMYDSEGKVTGVLGIARDITGRKHTEDELTARTKELEAEIEDRKHAEEKLLESETRYKNIFQNNHSVMLLIDPESARIIDANPAALSFYGYSHKEITEMKVSEINTLSKTEVHEEMERARKEQRWHFLFRHRLAGGSVKDVEVFSGPVKMHGRELLYSIIHDITDRKKAEDQVKASLAEKVVLLREIHHRVKNNFQVIMSLLKIQARHIQDESLRNIFKDSQNRIRSMALVHERLYRSGDLANIRSADFIKTLAGDLIQSYATQQEISLLTEVDDVSLPVDTAIPCGFIINELISNSLKHAFNKTGQGTVTISFHLSEDGAACELVVRDNGSGIPESIEISKVRSMGLSLVHSTVTRQLSGKIEISRTAGTEFRINFQFDHVENVNS